MESPLEMISPVPLSRVFCDLRSAIVHRFLIAKKSDSYLATLPYRF